MVRVRVGARVRGWGEASAWCTDTEEEASKRSVQGSGEEVSKGNQSDHGSYLLLFAWGAVRVRARVRASVRVGVRGRVRTHEDHLER